MNQPTSNVLNYILGSVDLLGSCDKVGTVFSIDYNRAVIAIYDHDREYAGGLPKGGFLVAARNESEQRFILLRIIGGARLPNSVSNDETRYQGVESTANEQHWSEALDPWTRDRLSIHGIDCRVLGTFVVSGQSVKFFEDIDNYYAVDALQVWKPSEDVLNLVVNHSHRNNPLSAQIDKTPVGRTRFAASEPDDAASATVKLDPIDLLQRRTVYLGMSRSGKSNAMKVAADRVYRLRQSNPNWRIGQLIFDPNGEYAQDNEQDGFGLHRIHNSIERERSGEVETYGLFKTESDPDRTIMKLNFYGEQLPNQWNQPDVERAVEQLLAGRDIVVDTLAGETVRYTSAFRDVDLSVPNLTTSKHGEFVRFKRVILAYQTALAAAGLEVPIWRPNISGLFGKSFVAAMNESSGDYQTSAARIIADCRGSGGAITWEQLLIVFTGVNQFINHDTNAYQSFNSNYVRESTTGASWADPKLRNILKIFDSQNGPRTFQRVQEQHDPTSAHDFAEDVVTQLRHGKLVIVDQSTGDPEMNRKAAERIMWKVFRAQQDAFRSSVTADSGDAGIESHILVYIEEAHNLLPKANSSDNLRTVWARAAKEGSKMNLGMILATQAPSSIMPEILSETDNWIIAYLNSRNERNVISGYMDFEDFIDQIGQVSEPGFVRMRTLSHAFTIPVQIDRFNLEIPGTVSN